MIFRAKRNHLNVEPRIKEAEDFEKELNDAELDLGEYDSRWGRYRIRITAADVKGHEELLKRVLKRAYDSGGGPE